MSDLDLTILNLTINLNLTIFSRETNFLLSKKSQFNKFFVKMLTIFLRKTRKFIKKMTFLVAFYTMMAQTEYQMSKFAQ